MKASKSSAKASGTSQKKPSQGMSRNDSPVGKQAVIVDYKAIGCLEPGESTNRKPFIQYSLEWLLIEEFDEVFICCLPDNAQQMRDFVKFFLRTENVPSNMNVQVHSSENNLSTGDCLRDLDSKGLIRADFVIMDVGCCGNLPLAQLLEAHKLLKKTDKNAILTSIVRNIFTKNLCEIGEFPIHVTDPTTGALLHYVAGSVNDGKEKSRDTKNKKSIEIPSNIFLERESVKINTNLCSTNLSIYSENVPGLYAELFDCHSEADLIQAAFDNHEVLGGTVYIHVVDDLFSQRMADFGFAINQKRDQFDTNLIYKRNYRYQVLRKLVNDSLIDCTRLNAERFLSNLEEDQESESESESESDESIMDEDEAFLCEVLDSLVRGYEESIENENLVLEVNSSRHAYNITTTDVVATIGRALILLPDKLTKDKPKSLAEYSNMVDKSISKFRQFLLNYIKNEESKMTLITTMEDIHLSQQVEFLNETVLAKIYYKLYEIDALDEDSILNWFKDYDQEDETLRDLRSKPALKQLIEALEADSSDEESD